LQVQENNTNKKKQRNNTSGFIGVYFDKQQKKWYSTISINYKRKFLGYFDTREEASKCYQEAVKQYFGEFANLK
jgi:hypothetical protein